MYKIKDIDDYQNRLTEGQAKTLVNHCNSHAIHPTITAWYDDMEDFYQDWIHDNKILETKEEADARFEEGIKTGEFCKFDNMEIVRLSY